MIDLKYIINNGVIFNCRAENDAKELLKCFHENGYSWNAGESYLETTN